MSIDPSASAVRFSSIDFSSQQRSDIDSLRTLTNAERTNVLDSSVRTQSAEVQVSHNLLKEALDFYTQMKALQGQAGSGVSAMPADMKAFLDRHGIQTDRTGNDDSHRKDEWSVNMGYMRTFVDAIRIPSKDASPMDSWPTEQLPRPDSWPTERLPRPDSWPTDQLPRPDSEPTQRLPDPSGGLSLERARMELREDAVSTLSMMRDLQDRAGNGVSAMPQQMKDFLQQNGIKFDSRGGDDLHTRDEWSINIAYMETFVNSLSTKLPDFTDFPKTGLEPTKGPSISTEWDMALGNLKNFSDQLITHSQTQMSRLESTMAKFNESAQSLTESIPGNPLFKTVVRGES